MKSFKKNHFLYFITSIPSLFVVCLIWMMFAPVQILEVKNNPMPLTKDILKRGESIPFVLDYCRPEGMNAYTVTPQIINGVVITLESFNSVLEPGCHKVISNTTRIPEELTPGKYHVHFIVEYRVNALRTEVLRYETQIFTVE